MAVPPRKKKMVARAHINIFTPAWRADNSYARFRIGSFYLCNLLTQILMTEKIKIKKEGKRIPVPKKPPKVEKDKRAYDRKKEKDKLRKHENGDK
jgi:hypothetical protein